MVAWLRVRVWALLLLVAGGCGGGGEPAVCCAPPPDLPPAKPGVLAISMMPRLVPYPATAAQVTAVFTEAFELAYNAGARGQVITYTWRALEPTAGSFDASKFQDLADAMALAQSRGITPFVGIQLINTTVLELPADLAGQALDSAAVTGRFHALLDRIVTPYRGRIKYLSVGNEVDAYLRQHPADWARYQRFYADAVAYAHRLDPALQVGVTATADGALAQSTADVRNLNTASDVVILTYYPIDADAQARVSVRDPSTAAGDIARMRSFAGTRPLVLQEVGYPAAASPGGSEAKQAAFFANVFAAWRGAAGDIPFLNVFLLHDFTPTLCTDFGAYYGITGSPTFIDYLCTLGLRQADGTPRAAWPALQQAAREAGLP